MGEWREYKLGEAPLAIIDGDRGKNYPSQSEFQPVGHCLFLSTKNVRETGFDFSDCSFISKDRDQLLRKGKLERFDTVLTTRGTIGNLGFYNETIPFDNIRINSGMVIIRPQISYLNPTFCYYIFRALQKDFESFTSGSAQPQLPIRDLSNITIYLPSLSVQSSISNILLNLDAKIDLLHRQNKTLEALGETLFRQWFVEGVEQSWEVKPLNDVISVKGGTTPRTDVPEYWDGDIAWTSPRDLSESVSIFLTNTSRKITKEGLAQIGSGLLQVGTVLLSSRAPIGYLVITDIPVAINQGYIAIICDKIVSRYFMYLWVKRNLDTIIGAANGTVFLEISKSTFKTLEISVPPTQLLEKFDSIVSHLFNKIKVNLYQIQTLTRLRDTLLPKLMSGEVRVKV